KFTFRTLGLEELFNLSKKATNNKRQFQRLSASENSNQKVSEVETLKASTPCRWQIHEALPAFYQKKAMAKHEQANPRDRLTTSSSLENPAEMLYCGKVEQQDSGTFEQVILYPSEVFGVVED
ncbi:hypothetical protein STEG23_032616, partial [Scotinomys teguina]